MDDDLRQRITRLEDIEAIKQLKARSVSYTHLTLPTKA